MAVILDADLIPHGEKGPFDLKAWPESRPGEVFETAVIAVAELWHEVKRASAPGEGAAAESQT